MTWQDHYDRARHLAARARTTTGDARRECLAQVVCALRAALDVAPREDDALRAELRALLPSALTALWRARLRGRR